MPLAHTVLGLRVAAATAYPASQCHWLTAMLLLVSVLVPPVRTGNANSMSSMGWMASKVIIYTTRCKLYISGTELYIIHWIPDVDALSVMCSQCTRSTIAMPYAIPSVSYHSGCTVCTPQSRDTLLSTSQGGYPL